ncbi:MAG: hypothetical protein ABI321_20245 [Polyangia bacterium]
MTKPKKAPEKARVIKMALVSSASNSSTITAKAPSSDKAVRILAKSLFRQLKDAGYQNRDILTLSTELVSLITTDMRPAASAPSDNKH